MDQLVLDMTKDESWDQLRGRVNYLFGMLKDSKAAEKTLKHNAKEDFNLLANKNGKIEQLQSVIRDLRTQIEDTNVGELRNASIKYESIIEDLREQLEDTNIGELRKANMDQVSTILDLREKIGKLNTAEPPTQYMEVEKLHTKIRDLQARIEQLSERISKLKRYGDNLQTTIRDQRTEMSSLEQASVAVPISDERRKNDNQFKMILRLKETIKDLQKELRKVNTECKEGAAVEDRLHAINTELRRANSTLSQTMVEQQNLIKVPQVDVDRQHAFTPYGEIRQRGLTIKMMGEKLHERRQLVMGLRNKSRYWRAKYGRVIAHLEKPCGRRHVTKVLDGRLQNPYDAGERSWPDRSGAARVAKAIHLD